MQTGSSVIIYPTIIVQHGLKDILLSKGISISGILQTCPETDILLDWRETLILADSKLYAEFKNHVRILLRNGNTLIGIEPVMDNLCYEGVFNGFLRINDDRETINHLLENYLKRISPLKSDSQLSSREIEVLTLVARGLSNKCIADQLFISIHTVITHRKNITFKLGIKSIPGLTLYAALNNLV